MDKSCGTHRKGRAVDGKLIWSSLKIMFRALGSISYKPFHMCMQNGKTSNLNGGNFDFLFQIGDMPLFVFP